MDYKPYWVSNSLNPAGFCEKPDRVCTDALPFAMEKCAFSVIFVPLFLENQSLPGIAAYAV